MKDIEDIGKDDFSSIRSSSHSSAEQQNMAKAGETDVESGHRGDAQTKPVKTPCSQYRGLFGRFAVIAEVDEPKFYPRKIKWFITFVIACAAIAAPLGSTIIFRGSQYHINQWLNSRSPALASLMPISKDLHTSPTITNLSAAFYMLAMSVFPLWWSSFSESVGRRAIYITSFSLFVLWNVLGAISDNIAMLIIMRTLGGGASASVQTVGAGTLADIWDVKERGRAMGIFYLGPLSGPLFGPILGGVLADKLGWRSTQWFLVIYGGILLLFLFFALPEVGCQFL